jgi:hypothetical protein
MTRELYKKGGHKQSPVYIYDMRPQSAVSKVKSKADKNVLENKMPCFEEKGALFHRVSKPPPRNIVHD